MGHSFNLTHTLYHLVMTALFVALIYAVILLVLMQATHAGRSGRRKSKWASGGPNRRQRRAERAMGRHRRGY